MKPTVSFDNVRILLDKYYQGYTTIKEEQSLREFFSSHEVPLDLTADKELFCSFYLEDSKGIIELNKSIQTAIRVASMDAKSNRKSIIRMISWSSAAASVLIIFTISWMLTREHQEYELVDTYDDPYLALQHTREVLEMVSGKMNFAMSELESLSALNNSLQKLEPIEQVTTQLDKISGIDRINKPIYYLSKPM